jgi:phosphoglycolate phosphatase-like HAD superfamily hydrolase
LNFQGVIFDVDGTLVDSNDAHAAAFVEAFGEFGFHIGFESVRRLIGMGADKLIARLIGRSDEAIAERKKALFMARHLPRVRPFPAGRVAAARACLQGRQARRGKLGCEGRARRAARADARQRVLRADRGRQATPRVRSPIPTSCARRWTSSRSPAEQCAMVGDTPYDAAAARRAGLAFRRRALRRLAGRRPPAGHRRL